MHKKPNLKPVTLKMHPELKKAVEKTAGSIDSDFSKFMRTAAREKLKSLGIKPPCEEADVTQEAAATA